ncbi:hypothetical protein SUDANB1_05579 [Streptomyces sp. enrichment culture]|uniref:hypothetical protein n=1 Tax=Streptomyces sp. enrichment culture TaxID=1795815 RepID=UPI003F57628E
MSNTTSGDVLACVAVSAALFAITFGPFCVLMNRSPEKDIRDGSQPAEDASTPELVAHIAPPIQTATEERPLGRHRKSSRKELR